ncbi:non-hydrolyzing UDP-N-acetylglucosamine 2-epimerase [Virgisporangium aurantiacum]|uniref:UDP-N-acetylglucosamine 2-epimerase (non-hydrolyzing) n=1 Tax=Virgisporangium aurantiacum TaxID=175570 RepID=A0A8J4E5X4_9ACTN|nr:UDP-N-acetylglucosamine 2-epimerase (non-hydrolyzing) [Virgisporangium aurantiacum]GIJ62604.1 UDP-N-acetylglucosamine 2-epimerase (non-hydrolyzing) [Virgisporangium aurantiacum]
MTPFTVHVVFGTRPEAIKLAPLVRAMRRSPALDPVVISTGQHRELLDTLLDTLQLRCQHQLAAMVADQSLCDLTSRMVQRLGNLFATQRPDVLLVHGDTATAFAGAVAGFYERIPVAHIEAGIRSGTPVTPFPEEFHRTAIARLTRWHFPSTDAAARNLLAEGVDPVDIEVTGSTAVDSLRWAMAGGLGRSAFTPGSLRNVLVTLHRRESQDGRIERVTQALTALAGPGTDVVILLHRNPAVRRDLLAAAANAAGPARFVEPLDYLDFVRTLAEADLVLTDSGGVQDEATALGKRMLVLRERTDRPEAVDAGTAEVIGLHPPDVVDRARREIGHPPPRRADIATDGPFGDGRSAERIVRRLSADLAVHAQPRGNVLSGR